MAPAAKQMNRDDARQVLAEDAIREAKELEVERQNLLKSIAENRTDLRSYERKGYLSDEEAQWLHSFYPNKAKDSGARSADEIKATRDLRKAAVKEITGQDAPDVPDDTDG